MVEGRDVAGWAGQVGSCRTAGREARDTGGFVEVDEEYEVREE